MIIFSLKNGFMLFLAILLQSLTSTIFKAATFKTDWSNLLTLLTNEFFIAGLFVFFLRTVIWYHLLKEYPVSILHPFMSFSLILILIWSLIIFNENITIENIIGSFFIAVGTILLYRDYKSTTFSDKDVFRDIID